MNWTFTVECRCLLTSSWTRVHIILSPLLWFIFKSTLSFSPDLNLKWSLYLICYSSLVCFAWELTHTWSPVSCPHRYEKARAWLKPYCWRVSPSCLVFWIFSTNSTSMMLCYFYKYSRKESYQPLKDWKYGIWWLAQVPELVSIEHTISDYLILEFLLLSPTSEIRRKAIDSSVSPCMALSRIPILNCSFPIISLKW